MNEADALWARGVSLFRSLECGTADPREVAAAWREIVDRETDPTHRAEAMINLASALDYIGNADAVQACAIAARALPNLGRKHPDAASAFLMAAQRIVRADSASPADLRTALDYLHAALAVPTTARSRPVLVGILVRYASVASRVGDFSKLAKARHVYDRLRKAGIQQDEIHPLLGSMVELFQARWEAEAHRPSLGVAITLSSEALRLFRADGRADGPVELSDLRQQHALLLLQRYERDNDETDFETAVELLRRAAEGSRNRAAILNSLAVTLMGSQLRPASEAEFDEARRTLVEALELATAPGTTDLLRWTDANWNLEAYRRGGPVDHLDRAVESAAIAVKASGTLGHRPLFTLADALHERFRVGRLREDIDRAVGAAERGLALCPRDYHDRWRHEVTAANVRQERAINNGFDFDEEDASRALELQFAALARLPRDSSLRGETAASALGMLIEHYDAEGDDRVRRAATRLALALPGTPSRAARLSSVAAVNLAVFHLMLAEQPADREGWLALLRDIALRRPDHEEGRLAAGNLMHLHADRDWNAVLEAYQIVARQRAARLGAARTPRDRAMVLRREQNLAAIAGLALAHLGRPAEAAQLIDDVQAALLLGAAAGPDGAAVGSSYDAVFYPVATRFGAYVLTVTDRGATAHTFPELRIELPAVPSVPDAATLAAASALLHAAFGESVPRRLLVVPAGELGLVPWAAVVHGSTMLVDVAHLSFLPTRRLRRAGRQVRASTLLIVDASNADATTPLPHAGAETLQLREWIPDGDDLRDTDATPDSVRAALARSDAAHFACHGVTNASEPTLSHLILHAGTLSVGDVTALDCRSLSLVSLSACRSAVHGTLLPDEFASLAVAFLVAGARFAVGTLWDVHDAAASLFSRRFFHQLRHGSSVPDGVREAQIWMRDTEDAEKERWLAGLGGARTPADERLRTQLRSTGSRRSFADPKHWAGFVCYG